MKSLSPSVTVTHRDPKGLKFMSTVGSAYDKANLDDDSAQRLNENAGFAAYLAQGIRRFSAKAPDYALAQSILGVDFITPEEVAKARKGIVYTDEQITALAENLPSEEVLMWCKENGYAVIPAPPTASSTLNVREIQSAHFYSKSGGWYAEDKETFAREDKTSSGWMAIKKTPVDNSTNKTWKEQTKLLSKVEMVPNTAEMTWFITIYFEVRGIRLFENVYVRTSSLDSDGSRVCVGGFDSGGLDVYLWHDDLRDGDLGVSAARKQ